jgi:nucleoside recognition membrane protein YjiH
VSNLELAKELEKPITKKEKKLSKESNLNNNISLMKTLFYSTIGILIFFIPFHINNEKHVLINHLYKYIKQNLGNFTDIYLIIITIAGSISPFINKEHKENKIKEFYYILRTFSIVIAFMAVYNLGPDFLYKEDIIPYIYEIIIKASILIPLTSIFLVFLTDYGLLEFVAVYSKNTMKLLFNTNGKSIVNLLLYIFSGYYSGFLMTNKLYKQGKYTQKEACIISTGFCLMPISYIITLSDELKLNDYLNIYIIVSILITLGVTVITSRIWPLNSKKSVYMKDKKTKEKGARKKRFKNALKEAIKTSSNSQSLIKNIASNLEDSLVVSMNFIPNVIMFIFIGYIIFNYTFLLDIMALVFYPISLMLKIPDYVLVSKGSILSSIDVFLIPNEISGATSIFTRSIIGVVSVASLISFSNIIPLIFCSNMSINLKELIIIWTQRVVLSLIIASLLFYISIGYKMV